MEGNLALFQTVCPLCTASHDSFLLCAQHWTLNIGWDSLLIIRLTIITTHNKTQRGWTKEIVSRLFFVAARYKGWYLSLSCHYIPSVCHLSLISEQLRINVPFCAEGCIFTFLSRWNEMHKSWLSNLQPFCCSSELQLSTYQQRFMLFPTKFGVKMRFFSGCFIIWGQIKVHFKETKLSHRPDLIKRLNWKPPTSNNYWYPIAHNILKLF